MRITSDLPLAMLAPFRRPGEGLDPPPALTPQGWRTDHPGPRVEGRLAGLMRDVALFHQEDGYGIEVAGVGRFLVVDGSRRVHCLSRAEGVPQATFEEVVLGPVLTLALAHRHIWCLHASAIQRDGAAGLILADSGCGKSTLAAYCDGRSGFRRLADDILPCIRRDERLLALPDFPQLKLEADRQYPRTAPPQVPVRALVFLQGGAATAEPELARLSPVSASKLLADQTVAIALFDHRLHRARLQFAAHLLAAAPAFLARVPHDYSRLPRVLELIGRVMDA